MRFSVWELLLVLLIVLVLFGGSRLRNLGGDLGSAIRGFRDAMREGKDGAPADPNVGDGPPTLFPRPDGQSAADTTAATHDPFAKKDHSKV